VTEVGRLFQIDGTFVTGTGHTGCRCMATEKCVYSSLLIEEIARPTVYTIPSKYY